MATQRWTSIGLALLLLGGLRIGYAQLLGRPGEGEPHGIDARYAGLKLALRQVPLEQVLFLQSDSPQAAPGDIEYERHLAQASYALAPRVVLPDRGQPGLVILDLSSASRVTEQLQEGHLEELWRRVDDLVLLARRAAP
jgi:hypothetical protein